jgi:hypothetical protein
MFAGSSGPANNAEDGDAGDMRVVDHGGGVEGELGVSEGDRAEQKRRWGASVLQAIRENVLPELEAIDPDLSGDEEDDGMRMQVAESPCCVVVLVASRAEKPASSLPAAALLGQRQASDGRFCSGKCGTHVHTRSCILLHTHDVRTRAPTY